MRLIAYAFLRHSLFIIRYSIFDIFIIRGALKGIMFTLLTFNPVYEFL